MPKGVKGFQKGHKTSEETRKKIGDAHRGKKKDYPIWNKGKPNPELSKRQKENNVSKRPKVKKKMSEAKIKYYAAGNKPWNYKDGSSRNRKYTKAKWVKLAKEIYKRDNWTCQKCGKKGGLLNAHHIIPWAGNEELRFNEDNLITLCVPCHAKIHYKDNLGRKSESQEVSQ